MVAGRALSALSFAAALGMTVSAAVAGEIISGPAGEPVHAQLCPRLESELKDARFRHACATSSGAVETIARIARSPLSVGFVPLDQLAHASRGGVELTGLTILGRSDARVCLFIATRSSTLQSYGDIAAQIGKVRVILPPRSSAGAEAFAYLQSIDPDGLGKARVISHAASAEDAVKEAMSADDIVTLVSEWPDPESPRLKAVLEADGRFVAFADRTLLRKEVLGRRIYLPVEVEVTPATWTKAARKVATVCSPIAIVAAAQSVVPERDRQDHLDLIATIETMRPEALTPRDGRVARYMKSTRDLTGASVEELIRLSEEARVKAQPYVDKAIAAGKQAVEAAKPHVEKAKDIGAEALAKAREDFKALMDGLRRDTTPRKE